MININEIPHLRTYKPKVSFPKDRVDGSKFSMVFLNGLTLEDNLNFVKTTSIVNRGVVRYFMERQYHGKLFSRTYHENLLSLKVDPVATSQGQSVRIERVFTNMRNSNTFVDLHMFNKIFFTMMSTGTSYMRKAEEYVTFMKNAMQQNEYRPYRHNVLIIDIDSWLKHEGSNEFEVNASNNPAMFIQMVMKKNISLFKELGDINIIFNSGDRNLRVNPSLCDRESHSRFRSELRMLTNGKSTIAEDDIESLSEREDVKTEVSSYFTDTGFRRLTGTTPPIKTKVDEVNKTVDRVIKKTIDQIDEEEGKSDDVEEIASKVADTVLDDKMIEEIASAATVARSGKNKASTKRDELLRDQQRKIKFQDKTLEEVASTIQESVIRGAIETNDVSNKVSTTNSNVTKVTFNQFEESYNKNLMVKDTVNVLKSLNTAEIPVFIRNINVEDTSNEMSLKETYTVDLEDGNRVRHRLKFDMPKFIDDKFMYLNGNKKLIVKQLLLKPIVKTGPNRVQIVSNYNKIFISRHGANVSSKITKMTKALIKDVKGITTKQGNQLVANKEYVTTIEYDELAKKYEYIMVGSKVKFYFNVEKIKKDIEKFDLPKLIDKTNENKYLPIGIVTENSKRSLIYVDTDTQNIANIDALKNEDIVTAILFYSGNDFSEMYTSQTAGKKYMYTSGTLMARQVPILLLLGYVDGLSSLLRKAQIKHYFSDTRPRTDDSQGVVQFEDGYLVFDRYPFENSLLLNAFSDVPTRAYKYADFDIKDTYVDVFDILFKQRNVAGGFDNFIDFMIDPITKEVLEDLDLPTEFVDVVLYGHKLLVDNDFTPETDMGLYRIRSNELVNVYLYKAIASAYRQYYNTSQNNNPTKISVPQDCITKEVLTAQTIEDYSILNPIVELEKTRAITPKGPSGVNLPQAFTIEKRSYSKSMVGLMAMTTSPDGNVGIVRTLTSEPSITSARGYIDVKQDDLDSLKDVNLFSPGELLSPLGASRDKLYCPTMQKCVVKNSSN